MNIYLQKFKDQAFEASIFLTKNVLKQHFYANLILFAITLILIFPLILFASGMSFSELIGFQDQMMEQLKEIQQNGEKPNFDFFVEQFKSFNFGFMAIVLFISSLINVFFYILYLKINENKIFSQSKNLIEIIKTINISLFIRLILGIILMYLTVVFTFIIFLFITVILAKASVFLSVFIGFLGFFFVIIFLFKLSLVVPAIVHGNLSINESFAYSFQNITWKRAALLFLFTFVLFIVYFIVSLILMSAIGFLKSDNGISLIHTGLGQIISLVLGVFFSAFLVSAMSTIYYRYANIEEEDDQINHHIIASDEE